MEEEIIVLLIEDSDADAQAFRLHILKNPKLNCFVSMVHCRTIQESFQWLSSNAPPYLICLDPGVPGLSEKNLAQVSQELAKYSNGALIGLTGADQNSAIFKKLERAVGREHTFSKDAIFDRNEQTMLLSVLQDAISKRSSGRSREMQMDLVRMEERFNSYTDDLNRIAEQSTKLYEAMFGNGDASVAFVTLKLSQSIPALISRIEALESELKKLQSTKEESNQLKQQWLSFWLDMGKRLGAWGVLALIFAGFILWLGADQALEFIKAIVNH